MELRLYKAALSSPEEQSNSSSDAVTIRELVDDRDGFEDSGGDGGGYGREVPSSCADSGHYEDCTNSSIHSKDSVHISEDNNLSVSNFD